MKRSTKNKLGWFFGILIALAGILFALKRYNIFDVTQLFKKKEAPAKADITPQGGAPLVFEGTGYVPRPGGLARDNEISQFRPSSNAFQPLNGTLSAGEA